MGFAPEKQRVIGKRHLAEQNAHQGVGHTLHGIGKFYEAVAETQKVQPPRVDLLVHSLKYVVVVQAVLRRVQ